MTVHGVGGTGKSTLINFIQSAVENKFRSTETIQVIAPTGQAANITKGNTIHYRFEIPIHKTTSVISATTLKRQLQKNSKLAILFLDE
jgi:predicted ABC-type ATPase